MVSVVGKEFVLDEPKILERYSWDKSLTEPGKADFIVKPQNAKEVVEIVKLANKYSTPITPCSSGIHCGGNTVPVKGGIMLDLERMNRILVVETRNRMVRFEPGVRYGPLQTELAKYQLMALIPLLPNPEKSVLSSHLERDPMLVPKFEYGDPVLTMELVLPEGQIFRTGSASAPGAPDDTLSDLVGPYGPGLDFFRLFLGAQGTLGIVTWMSVKVEHLPQVQKFFFIPFESLADAVEPTYRIQRRMLGNECFLVNNRELATIVAEESEKIKALETKLPQWAMVLCLAGGARRPEEKIAYEEKALQEIAAELNLNLSEPTGLPEGKLIENGLPQTWPSSKTYWKNRLKGGHYDLGFHTTLDKAPEMFKKLSEVCRDEINQNGIGQYIQPLERARACYCESTFYYDPTDAAQMRALAKLIEKTAGELISKGALFTRPDHILSKLVYSLDPTYTSVLEKIKNLLDPNHIMNPGRLRF